MVPGFFTPEQERAEKIEIALAKAFGAGIRGRVVSSVNFFRAEEGGGRGPGLSIWFEDGGPPLEISINRPSDGFAELEASISTEPYVDKESDATTGRTLVVREDVWVGWENRLHQDLR